MFSNRDPRMNTPLVAEMPTELYQHSERSFWRSQSYKMIPKLYLRLAAGMTTRHDDEIAIIEGHAIRELGACPAAAWSEAACQPPSYSIF